MQTREGDPHRPAPERLVVGLRQLHPVGRVLIRLKDLLTDPNAGLEDIAELIRLDAALATRVIHISNSVWFGRGTPCSTIEDAVNRVGFREVYHLVAIMASGAIVAQPLTAYRCDALTMWRESVSCAFAAEMLAARRGDDTAVAYTVGLLHAIGRLAINQYIAESDDATRQLADEGFPLDYSSAEFALLGFNQAAVAACMLEKWDFEAAIVEPIRHQYDPLGAEEPHDAMAGVLYGARMLRTAIERKAEAVEIAADSDILASLRMSREEMLSYLPELEEQLARVQQLTKM